MAFYGYQADPDYCYSTPYNSYEYDSNPIQYSSSYNSPEFPDYDFPAPPPELNYSVYTYSDPNITSYVNPIEYNYTTYNYQESYVNPSDLVLYEKPSYDQHQFYSPTEFRLSYSVSSVPPVDDDSEFNEGAFDEYDPTPYGGGYDPVTTYGKPLPPSDKICYPKRSAPTAGPIALPDKQMEEIAILPKPIEAKPAPQTEIPATPIETKPAPPIEIPIETKPDPKIEVAEQVDMKPSNEIVPFEIGNGGDQSYGYESSERQTRGMPYGSGLESMDLCEALFGYWPCVAKREREERQRQAYCGRERRDDPWNTAADYLFGGPIASGYESYPQLSTLDHDSEMF